MSPEISPYPGKPHERVGALLFVSVLLVAFVLRTSAYGQGGTLSGLISVAPQPFWSTISLFQVKPRLSQAMVSPTFFAQGQPDYGALSGADFSALAGLAGSPSSYFSPSLIVDEKVITPEAPVDLEFAGAHRSSESSGPDLADTWSRVAGVGSTIPIFTSRRGTTDSTSAAISHPQQNQTTATNIVPRTVYSGQIGGFQTSSGAGKSTPTAKYQKALISHNVSWLNPKISAPDAPAASQYFAGDGSAVTASKWGPNGGPYAAAFVPGNIANFAVVNGTGAGSSLTFGGFVATENFTLTSTFGTFSTLSNGVVNVNVSNGKVLDFSAQMMSGASGGGYTFTGPGVWATVGNTYQGGFTINSGTLIARGNSAMGGGFANTLTINGGTITGPGSGSGSPGGGSRDFLAKYGGGITVGGNFQLGALTTAIALSSDTANLTFTDTMNLGAATRTITIGANGTYNLNGIIQSNPGVGLTIDALANTTGAISLGGSSANTYSGTTTVTSGKLNLDKMSGMTAIGGNLIIGDAIGSAGTATVTLQLTNQVADSSDVTINSDGLFNLGGRAETIDALNGETGAAVTVTNTTLTVGASDEIAANYQGVISGSGGVFTKMGTGTQTLSGANTYGGGTNLNGGTLALGSAGAIGTGGTISFGGGTLQHSASNTADYSGRFSTAANQQYRIDTNGQTLTYNTSLSSSGGSLTKLGNGTLVLPTSNSYGATTIDGGTLQARVGSLVNVTGGVTVNSGGTLLLSGTGRHLGNAVGVNLDGGTFNTGGLSEPGGTLGSQNTGALTLTSTSTIDFGAGNLSVLEFAGVGTHTASTMLQIINWDGVPVTGGSGDRLLFNGSVTTFLSTYNQGDVSFNGLNGYLAVQFDPLGPNPYFEVTSLTPVPEPSTWAAATLALGAIGWTQLRKRAHHLHFRPLPSGVRASNTGSGPTQRK
jgi:autotransporter-associated beta strand protein